MVTSTNSLVIHDDDLHEGSAKRAQANGLASLDAAGHVPAAQLGGAEMIANKDQASGYPGLDASVLLALAQQRLNFYIGNLFRTNTDANGTQAITGVGFRPRVVLFLSVVTGNSAMSVCADDGANPQGICNSHVDTANSWTISTDGIEVRTAAGVKNTAKITTIGADGFTLTWTKTGAPAGTTYARFIAFR